MKFLIKLLLTLGCIFYSSAETHGVTVKFEYSFRNTYDLASLKETSIKIMNEVLKRDYKNGDLHFVLGSLYIPDDLAKAKREFKEVIKLKPDHFLSYVILGYLAELEQSEAENPINYFKQAMRCDYDNPIIYNSLAAVYMRRNKIDEALNILENGIRANDRDESLYFNQTLILLKYPLGQSEKEKIVRNMTRAIRLSKKEEYFFILGNYYLQIQNFDEARNAFEQTTTLNPNNVYALLGLATTYKETHHYEKALEIARRALALEPTNKDVQEEISEYEAAYSKWKEHKR